MYKKISLDYIDKFKEILLDDKLDSKKIKLKIPRLNIKINIDKTSIPKRINDSLHDIQFSLTDDIYVVEHENKKYTLDLKVWERINSREEYSVNVGLSCDCSDFGEGTFGNDFYQIEVEDSLEDNEYVYLVRNISKLYRNDPDFLQKEYGDRQILSHNEEYLLVISKVKKSDLDDLTKHSEILIDFFKNFIMCAFINEGLKIGI
jgi:hypothetical protein